MATRIVAPFNETKVRRETEASLGLRIAYYYRSQVLVVVQFSATAALHRQHVLFILSLPFEGTSNLLPRLVKPIRTTWQY